MTNRDDQRAMDLLDQAIAALRDAPVPDGPPADLVASTVEALHTLPTPPVTLRRYERKRIMFRFMRYGSLVAASVLVAVAACFWLFNPGPAPAFDEVIAKIRNAKSVHFTVKSKIGKQLTMTQKLYLQGDALRIEVPTHQEGVVIPPQLAQLPTLVVWIVDVRQKQGLKIDYMSKTAEKLTITPEMARDFNNPVEGLRKLTAQDAERIEDEVLDGRKTHVYRLKKIDFWAGKGKVEEGETVKVWVDAQSNLPVRLLLETFNADRSAMTRMVFDQFTWNEALDANLFKLDVPQGFTVQEKKAEPGQGEEP